MNAKHSPKTYCLVCKKLTGNTNLKTVKEGRLVERKTNDKVNLPSLWK